MDERDPRRVVNPRRILLTTDFSENSKAAFPYAAALAEEDDSELILVHVISQEYYTRDIFDASPMMDDFVKLVEKEAKEKLNRLDVPGTDDMKLKRKIVRGSTSPAGIVECAGREDADLIVMATRGHGVFHQVVMGSSARGVVASAPCPVLCVKPGEKGMLDEASGSIRINRILVPTDASDHSLKALRLGVELARKHEAEVSVVYISETQVPPMYRAAGVESMFSLDGDLPNRIREHLKSFVQKVDTQGVKCDIEIHEGSPSREIAKAADESDADLIVICRKGVGDTPHLLGGVTERLLHDAKHPMLVV